MNKKMWELNHRLLYIEGMSDCQKGITPRKQHPTYLRAYSEEYARGEKPIIEFIADVETFPALKFTTNFVPPTERYPE